LAGVIVLFMSDETLLTAIEWAVAFLGCAILIALPFAIVARRYLPANVLSPFALLQEVAGERLRLGGLLPAHCPIRSASVSDRTVSPVQFRLRAGSGLRGWQSDGR
jgi:hypothetical protein